MDWDDFGNALITMYNIIKQAAIIKMMVLFMVLKYWQINPDISKVEHILEISFLQPPT